MYLFQGFMAYDEQKTDMESPLKLVFYLSPYQLENGYFWGKKKLTWGGLRETSFQGDLQTNSEAEDHLKP